MGRKGSALVPFLKNALLGDKYINLKFEGNAINIFILNFPHSSSRLGTGCQMILKDWYDLKGRNYEFSKDYRDGRQGLESALRNSDFLECLQSGRNKTLIYRFLESEEIIAKKLSKKASKKKLKEDSSKNTDQAPSSVQSSGYGSGEASPIHYNSHENHSDHSLTHAVKHDEHNYALLYALQYDHENVIQSNCVICPELMQPNYLESDNLVVECPVVEHEAPPVEHEAPPVEHEAPPVEHQTPLLEHEDPLLENEGLIVENKGPMNPNIFPVSQMEIGDVCFNSENVIAPLADVVGCSNIWYLDEHNKNPYITNGLSSQDSCKQDINQLLHIDNFLIPSSENYEELLKIESEFLDLSNFLTEKETSTTIDPPSFKTQKVFECLYQQQIPGMVLLTFQLKVIEFCGYDGNADELDSTKFIFDEATLKMISSCTLLEKKVLREDLLLLIFKCIG